MRLSPETLPTTEMLEAMPTLSEGYTCDLKIDDGDVRIWLHRTSIEDGEPFLHAVTIEIRHDGCWYDVLTYDGDDPTYTTTYVWTDEEHLIDPYQEGGLREHR